MHICSGFIICGVVMRIWREIRILLFFILLIGTINVEAKRVQVREPAFPQVWYKLDTALVNPSLCDTINLPTSYTMMMVYQSLQPDSTQQLWKINRTDDRYYSIGTHCSTTEQSNTSLYHSQDQSTPYIYTLQHTIKQDTSYHDIAQLFIGADSQIDSSHIMLYEAAYFDHRLPKYQSLMFQTYLALKYGITLDNVPYIATSGDTLWDVKKSRDFYHHIQGVGTNTEYNFVSTRSTSLEDSTISILVRDTLPTDSYVLLGDNNAESSWLQYEDDLFILQKIWKMSVVGQCDSILLRLNLRNLQDTNSDTLQIVILDNDYNIIGHIDSDSIDSTSSYSYYIIYPHNGMYFSICSRFTYRPTAKLRRSRIAQDIEEHDYVNITPNPTDGDFILSIHLAEEKSVVVIIQDMSGKTIHYQILNNIKDYTYKGRISTQGCYVVSISDKKHNVIATKELIVL